MIASALLIGSIKYGAQAQKDAVENTYEQDQCSKRVSFHAELLLSMKC